MSNPQITIKPRRVSVTVEQPIATVLQVNKQGPAGATGQPGNATFEAAETDSTCVAGQPLYLKSNGHVDLAQADTIATARVCGLAVTTAAPTTSVDYSADSVVSLTDWSAIAGSSALTPGALYYLSPDSAGLITAIAPTASGQIVAAIGRALTTQKLEIEIQPTIWL